MYYLLLIFLYPLSLLPLKVLYLFSDFACWLLFRLMRYRKDVVIENLTTAFPERNTAEIEAIYREFCRSFCDQWIETIKLLSMSMKELEQRVTGNWQGFHQLFEQGKNIYAVLGHQFNWEWGNIASQYHTKPQFAGIYLPLSSKAADKIMLRIRARSGSMLVPANDMKSAMIKLKDQQHMIGFIADQSPGSLNQARWYRFLNRPAAFVTGAEKGARRAHAAVVFVALRKVKRGYYNLHIEPICDNAADTPPGFITREYVKRLERDIIAHPANWLWSHRRWKLSPGPDTFIIE